MSDIKIDVRNFRREGDEHRSRQSEADAKIAPQDARMNVFRRTPKQRSDDQQIMNEMKANKASVDLNRAIFDYENELEDRAAHTFLD